MSARIAILLGCLLGLQGLGWAQEQGAPTPHTLAQDPDPRTSNRHSIAVPKQFAAQGQAFLEALQTLGVQQPVLHIGEPTEALVTVQFAADHKEDGFSIGPVPGQDGGPLRILAGSSTGAAHALGTLLLDASVQEGLTIWNTKPRAESADLPYRSFMVDMGRNPISPQALRHVIDLMWLCKANYLHLHLTDDQMISWPSRAFPKLYSERAGWTWEDFVALEAYSQARGVTLIPEIDVPGHSTILRREYPEVFGETPTDLASSEAAQAGVETLIGEFCQVFQASPYIHIGGDEAYGVPQDIQRDFINRLNRYVRAQGKSSVVWEGPGLGQGENKVDTSVLHINWRTIEFPAQAMLDAGYEVINAAWDPLYIVDHYPRTMFTAVDLERLYHWEPRRFGHVNHDIPTFSKPHMAKSRVNILGFCMPFWEGREENLLPLCAPRLVAIASRAWDLSDTRELSTRLEEGEALLARWKEISGASWDPLPFADPNTQTNNLAFRAQVRASAGNHQPHFGPARLTNGITDRFDHFLGFPTQPEPLLIDVRLPQTETIGRIRIFETAVGESQELYEVLVSNQDSGFVSVGQTDLGSRGAQAYVEHTFPARPVNTIRIATRGCHNLTFPSFSRLTEVMAFAE